MKFSTFLPVSATFLLVGTVQGLPAAYDNELTLNDALMMLESGGGIRVLGHDGVLRRLNVARTEVVDYVQLSAHHVDEFVAWKYPSQRDTWAGVDGRAITDEVQLLTVPDFITPLDMSTLVSMPKHKTVLERQEPSNCRSFDCKTVEECRVDHPPCQECEPFQECVGGPTGCLVQYLCDNTIR